LSKPDPNLQVKTSFWEHRKLIGFGKTLKISWAETLLARINGNNIHALMFRENADNIWHEPANFAMPERIQQNHCFAIAVMTHKHAKNDTVVSLLIIVLKVRFVTSGKLGVCPNHSQTVVPSTIPICLVDIGT